MEINFNGSTKIDRSQFGDNSVMNIYEKEYLLSRQDWIELKEYFDKRLFEISENSKSHSMVQKTLKYVEEQDENGLRGYIKRNKEMFFTNILSNTVSAGVNLILNRLGV